MQHAKRWRSEKADENNFFRAFGPRVFHHLTCPRAHHVRQTSRNWATLVVLNDAQEFDNSNHMLVFAKQNLIIKF